MSECETLPTHIALCPRCAPELYYPLDQEAVRQWVRDPTAIHCPECGTSQMIVYIRCVPMLGQRDWPA